MTVVAYIMAGLIFIGGWMLIADPPKRINEQSQSTSAPEQPKLPLLTPDELVLAYEENSVGADSRFKGKAFRVQGKVTDINTNISGSAYITMANSKRSLVEPTFFFKSGQMESIGKLRKGQTVEVSCIGAGDVLKAPLNKDCTLL